ncbi:hypothetical protein SynBIOSE41_01560 [Synechococcus sp. BIOS-E4-1]|nr:hypothetical protein SynBIOSE41_01560 [Synechococcus sp. BIOS-E4-1]
MNQSSWVGQGVICLVNLERDPEASPQLATKKVHQHPG